MELYGRTDPLWNIEEANTTGGNLCGILPNDSKHLFISNPNDRQTHILGPATFITNYILAHVMPSLVVPLLVMSQSNQHIRTLQWAIIFSLRLSIPFMS